MLTRLSRVQARQAGHHGFQQSGPLVMAAYICKRCDIEGQDLEVAPGRVLCWNCAGQAVITARIVVNAAYQEADNGTLVPVKTPRKPGTRRRQPYQERR
jgi:hypothetical protein